MRHNPDRVQPVLPLVAGEAARRAERALLAAEPASAHLETVAAVPITLDPDAEKLATAEPAGEPGVPDCRKMAAIGEWSSREPTAHLEQPL